MADLGQNPLLELALPPCPALWALSLNLAAALRCADALAALPALCTLCLDGMAVLGVPEGTPADEAAAAVGGPGLGGVILPAGVWERMAPWEGQILSTVGEAQLAALFGQLARLPALQLVGIHELSLLQPDSSREEREGPSDDEGDSSDGGGSDADHMPPGTGFSWAARLGRAALGPAVRICEAREDFELGAGLDGHA